MYSLLTHTNLSTHLHNTKQMNKNKTYEIKHMSVRGYSLDVQGNTCVYSLWMCLTLIMFLTFSERESKTKRKEGDPSITGTRPKRAAHHNSFTLNGCQFFLFI